MSGRNCVKEVKVSSDFSLNILLSSRNFLRLEQNSAYGLGLAVCFQVSFKRVPCPYSTSFGRVPSDATEISLTSLYESVKCCSQT